ncbi:MAG: PilX N-terminal domain-containing pilus assembly protein [Mariprofundaceae bacterium]|nr:PilX N-terminal domain-containing pilus assembly protein [Mariprofundaceae bacterium]
MADDFIAMQGQAGPDLSERRYEQGVVLVFSLFILLILAAIGLAASSTSVFQQRMSGNLLDQDMAFQSAESSLRTGEAFVESLASLDRGVAGCDASSAPCVSTINSVNGGVFANAATLPWGDIYTFAMTGFAGPKTVPEFIVEYDTNLPDTNSSLGIGTGMNIPGSDFYRVTARGTGWTDSAQVVVQSVYARRF